jgi:hypothetical protein
MDKISSFWLESMLLAEKYYPRVIWFYCSTNHTLQFSTDAGIEASNGLVFQAISVLEQMLKIFCHCSLFPSWSG